MTSIIRVHALEVLDSRGNPTVRAEVTLDNGAVGSATVPSGASTGTREATELRDNDSDRYSGNGVRKAVNNVNGEIANEITGMDAYKQQAIDEAIIQLDGTAHKSRLGANATLSVSIASMKAAANSRGIQLHAHLSELAGLGESIELPVPMFNILNGGVHAHGSTDLQEFMIAPVGVTNFREALRAGSEIYHGLYELLQRMNIPTTVGDEGGFAPPDLTTRQALDYLIAAIEQAGYRPGQDVFIALDAAASEFCNQGSYVLERESRSLTASQMVAEYRSLVQNYPIYSIEDGMAEDDWAGWVELTRDLGQSVQIVGDDLFVTQSVYLRRGIKAGAANAILIKPNQVGTITETLDAINEARASQFGIVISHRSGETEDWTIADLAVGVAAGQIKAGAPARGERTAKYNRLSLIESNLGDRATYRGRQIIN